MVQAHQQDQLSGSLQENALTLLCFSDRYHGLVRGAVPVELFSTFLYRDVVSRVYAYIDQFRKPPRMHLPDLVEDLLEQEDDKSKNLKALLRSVKELGEQLNEEYAVSQIQTFVRQQRLKLGVVEAIEAIEKNDLDSAERVVLDSVRARPELFNAGVTLEDVFKDLGRKDRDTDRILVGIPEMDHYGYGPTRKQLFAFAAPFGRGKTWWWLHCAKQALLQKWRVLYVTLEVDPEILGRRVIQSLFSITKRQGEAVRLPVLEEDEQGKVVGVSIDEHDEWPSIPSSSDRDGIRKLGSRLTKFRARRNLMIKQFPTAQLTHGQLVAYLDSLESVHRFVPDLLVIDYPKLMNLDVRNLRLELGAAYEKLRGLGVERNMAVGIAAQVNREGTQAKQSSEAHIGEDISIMGTADIAVFYNQTEAEHDMQLARLYMAKGRDDRSRYTVLITQAYEIGQFVLESRMLSFDYWMVLEKMRKSYDAERQATSGGDSKGKAKRG